MWKAKTASTSENSGSRKRSSTDVEKEKAEDQELDDIATSPNKAKSQELMGGGHTLRCSQTVDTGC